MDKRIDTVIYIEGSQAEVQSEVQKLLSDGYTWDQYHDHICCNDRTTDSWCASLRKRGEWQKKDVDKV